MAAQSAISVAPIVAMTATINDTSSAASSALFSNAATYHFVEKPDQTDTRRFSLKEYQMTTPIGRYNQMKKISVTRRAPG